MGESQDIVVLRVPRGPFALPAMRVVIGGVASRHKLGLDELDDVQLAVENLLAEESQQGGPLELRVWMAGDGLHVRMDGFTNQEMKKILQAPVPAEPFKAYLLGLRLFLPSLVNSYRVVDETGDSYAIEMEKRAS